MKKIQEFQDYSNESEKLHPSDEFETIFNCNNCRRELTLIRNNSLIHSNHMTSILVTSVCPELSEFDQTIQID
jgi:hypothetical protein